VAWAVRNRSFNNHIVEKKYQRVLIFEDDVVPLTKHLSQIPAMIDELPDDWDLVYFGYTKHEVVTPRLRRKQAFYKIISPLKLIKWNNPMIRNLLPVPYSQHLKKAGYHDCTHAYAIAGETATRLIARQTPVIFNADTLLSDLILKGEIKAFVTEPKFFIQENHLDPQHPSIVEHR